VTLDLHEILIQYYLIYDIDEEMTALQQRRLSKQQTIIESDLKNAQQLRMLFSKPGSSVCTPSAV